MTFLSLQHQEERIPTIVSSTNILSSWKRAVLQVFFVLFFFFFFVATTSLYRPILFWTGPLENNPLVLLLLLSLSDRRNVLVCRKSYRLASRKKSCVERDRYRVGPKDRFWLNWNRWTAQRILGWNWLTAPRSRASVRCCPRCRMAVAAESVEAKKATPPTIRLPTTPIRKDWTAVWASTAVGKCGPKWKPIGHEWLWIEIVLFQALARLATQSSNTILRGSSLFISAYDPGWQTIPRRRRPTNRLQSWPRCYLYDKPAL